MAQPIKQVIKRTISHRQNNMKDALLADANLQRTSLEMSCEINSAMLKPSIRLSRKMKGIARKKEDDDSKISMHPFSFISHKLQRPEEFKSNEQANAFIYQNYDIFDLSYSLICSQFSKFTLLILYMVLVSIRYGSMLCLVYITIITDSKYWEWIFCILITYVIYFISMIKVSLRPAENKCQTILKLTFDSLQTNEVVEYFQTIHTQKLIKSIFRALVPPEFSFLYIIASSQMKRVQIYCMINYIYSSIEAVVYYPFFIIYTSLYFSSTMELIPQAAYLIVMGAIVLAESIFLMVTGYLVWYGCKKRGYGRQKQSL